ncbi:MAG: DUF2079 domain-containing protein, partial [Anaerolineae bacterium]
MNLKLGTLNQKSPADFAVWGIILLFAITFSLLALNRHAAFESNGFDLGNVNQAVWNTARGQFLGFTNMLPLTNRLALHVEPVLLLLVPFYWLGVGGPEFLLVAQAVVVALGAWPLYRIARRRLGGWGGVVIAAAYLLYPALEAAVMFDFHAVTLAPTFFLFTLDALERENLPGAAVSLGLAMACKEDMGLVAAMLGLYVGLAHRRWKPALTMAAVFLIQPMFAPGGNIQANRYAWLFEALAQPGLIWEHLWHRAGLPAYLWGMFAPVGGLALLSPLALLPVLPSLAINLLSSHGLQWRLEEFHYAAPVAPFVFIAATQTIAKVIEARRQVSRFTFYVLRLPFRSPAPLLIVLIVASLSYHYYRGFTPLARPFRWRPVTVHQQIGAEMAAQISADLPLFAPLNLNPHVSSRRVVLQNWDDITPDDWLWLDV